jgi:hypothetical protein
VNKGKGILQPHHILDALDEVHGSGGGALAEGPFLDVLRSAQVRRRAHRALAFSVAMWTFFFFHFSVDLCYAELLGVACVNSRPAGGDRAAAVRGHRGAPAPGGVGVRPPQRARAQRRAAHHPGVPALQGGARRRPVCAASHPLFLSSVSLLREFVAVLFTLGYYPVRGLAFVFSRELVVVVGH